MAKKQVKNKVPSKKYEKYTISGDKIERKATCPRCGPGIFLADHKDRTYCGKCHYVEIKAKKE
jgi:small subunit ribosomal protein S27Ae